MYLQDLKQPITVRPASGEAFTPSKMLLMGAETKMNLLHPDGKRLWYADIETGTVVSDWNASAFNKDETDVSMRVRNHVPEYSLRQQSFQIKPKPCCPFFFAAASLFTIAL